MDCHIKINTVNFLKKGFKMDSQIEIERKKNYEEGYGSKMDSHPKKRFFFLARVCEG